jgi:hypothetical protein
MFAGSSYLTLVAHPPNWVKMGVLSCGEDSLPAPLRVRELTDEARFALARLARSRTAATRLTERARLIWYASRGEWVEAIAERLVLLC